MTDKLLASIEVRYPLQEQDVGEFSILKAGGMTFSIRAFHAKGLGHVSVMKASGFLGLMKMDTLMIVPNRVDLPLYSYDRIHAMGNDTLIVELYDTLTQAVDLSLMERAKEDFDFLPERDPGKHWYDDIKLSSSISKKAKKASSAKMDALTLAHFEAYLSAKAPAVTDALCKADRSAAYVNGLLEQGGPSTDVFKKALGEEKTAKLFRTVLFGFG